VSLLEFVREHILPYTDDADKEVRAERHEGGRVAWLWAGVWA
jgi:hypothetical protein